MCDSFSNNFFKNFKKIILFCFRKMAEEKMFFGGVLTEFEIRFLESPYTNYVGCLECFTIKIRPELKKLQEAMKKQRNMESQERDMDLETKEIESNFYQFYDKFVCPHSEETHIENPISEENGADWVDEEIDGKE